MKIIALFSELEKEILEDNLKKKKFFARPYNQKVKENIVFICFWFTYNILLYDLLMKEHY